ncbi:MAG TPA: DNA polymerase [Candidatus Paceibacterota bacterium]|nr:DNA polymerase [Candidatus Paceibacterota bacterium]
MANKKKDKKRLILLDSHAIIHRAYHALPEFMNSQGEPTGALYGLATMLFKIITDLKPDYIVACFDLPKKTFRHEAYDAYKAGRAKADDALVAQLIRSRDFFKACSIPIYECEGFEADDLLGTIVEQLKNKKKEFDIIIASGDMDTLQLVDDNIVQVYTLKKGINDTILYNEEKVLERFGFSPKNLPDYKGLRGDPSDNIIGIKGIGEKTATILVSKYGTVENIYKAIKKDEKELKSLGVTDRIITLLKDGQEEALFSKTLATIRRDANITFEIPEKNWRETVNKDNVAEFFRVVEFKSLQNRFLNVLDGGKSGIGESSSSQGPRMREDEEPDLAHTTFSDSGQTDEKLIKAKIAFWLLNSERTDPEADEVIHYKGSSSLEEAMKKLEEDIKKENLTYVYENIEVPIIPIIEGMEKRGIMVDVSYLKKMSEEYHKDLSLLEKNIRDMAGLPDFNINSPKQISEVLFNKLGLSVKGIKKSAGGAISTRESELEKLRGEHPIIGEILKHRELQKLLSTYIDTIPLLVGEDGRLHAHFIQAGTTTGRFSSNNPNLQNIPIKTERGKNIRNAFVAPDGYVLASFDYSQIELRVAALMSQDPYFIKAFNENRDIHSAVAMKVFNVSEENVTHDMRRRAKVINFGILYGMGVTALRQNLTQPESDTNTKVEITRKDAQIFYDNYFAQFPTIARYLESIKNFAKQNGYTVTLFGRKRYFPGIKSPIPFIKAMAERMATNAPIQGTATADIIKIGMKKADDALREAGLIKDVNLILQIHDELVYEIKKDKLEKAMKIIEKAMKEVIPDEFLEGKEKVPLLVSSSYGNNWGELK